MGTDGEESGVTRPSAPGAARSDEAAATADGAIIEPRCGLDMERCACADIQQDTDRTALKIGRNTLTFSPLDEQPVRRLCRLFCAPQLCLRLCRRSARLRGAPGRQPPAAAGRAAVRHFGPRRPAGERARTHARMHARTHACTHARTHACTSLPLRRWLPLAATRPSPRAAGAATRILPASSYPRMTPAQGGTQPLPQTSTRGHQARPVVRHARPAPRCAAHYLTHHPHPRCRADDLHPPPRARAGGAPRGAIAQPQVRGGGGGAVARGRG
jgi:hypothetical protein